MRSARVAVHLISPVVVSRPSKVSMRRRLSGVLRIAVAALVALIAVGLVAALLKETTPLG